MKSRQGVNIPCKARSYPVWDVGRDDRRLGRDYPAGRVGWDWDDRRLGDVWR